MTAKHLAPKLSKPSANLFIATICKASFENGDMARRNSIIDIIIHKQHCAIFQKFQYIIHLIILKTGYVRSI